MADQDVPSWPPPTLSPALPVAQYKNERKMFEEIEWTKTQDYLLKAVPYMFDFS